MLLYGRLWLTFIALLGAAGCILAVAFLPVTTLIGVALVGFGAVVVVGLKIHDRVHADVVVARPIRFLLIAGLVGGLTMVAAVSLTMLFGGQVLLLIPLLVLGCPPTWRRTAYEGVSGAPRSDPCHGPRAKERRGEYPGTSDATGSTWQAVPRRSSGVELNTGMRLPHGAALDQMPVHQLCWWWRASFTTLQRTSCDAHRISVVGLRQDLLDQLAQRNPVGFSRWLNSGARAAGDPSRYLEDLNPLRGT